jgi:16S rRNA A1518/A1519 N6-dimethyltransferase RsmA/KsgA/DIM1 with predicted DNA glycosylase/AP lyase activity
MKPEQRAKLIDAMAHIDGIEPSGVMERLGLHASDLKEGDPDGSGAHEIVEHITRKGKTLRGVIRRDLSQDEAKQIDEYTFRKDGGWFIREKHLETAAKLDAARHAGIIDDAQHETARAAAAKDGPSGALGALQQQPSPNEPSHPIESAAPADRPKEQADKLREAGEKLKAAAEADLGRDRLANTARRARMAAGAEADASQRLSIAGTMINLADAIEAGDARHLKGITTRAAVETLDGMVRRAVRETDRHLPYIEQRAREGRSPEPDDIRNARLPRFSVHGNVAADIAEKLRGVKGAAKLSGWAYRISERVGRDAVATLPDDDAETIRAVFKKLADMGEKHMGWDLRETLAVRDRLARAGITSDRDLRLALTEYLIFRDGPKKADPIKEAERVLVGQKVGVDFFPTPKPLAAKMAELAGVKPGMTVLEPSAGNGHLADAARDAGAQVDTVEVSDALRNVLHAKGHNIAGHDFDTFEPGKQYDAVIMNPPFSDRRDAAHIMRAYDLLKPGGKLVAIAGEGVFFGSDQKAQTFRDWLDERGAEVERLPEGTFKGSDLPAQTGANARLIVVEKPAHVAAAPVQESAPSMEREQPSIHEQGPKEGETKFENGVEYVLRDGRWHRAHEDQADERGAVSDAVLEDVGLLREFGGNWQYKFGIDGRWMTANSKEDAVSIATKTYHETPESERMTRDQRDAKADADEYEDLHRRYGHLSVDDLRDRHEKMGGEIEGLQAAGRREFNGGGRRTSAAVSAQGARDVSEERSKLDRYIERRAADEAAAPVRDAESDLASDREELATELARDPHSEPAKEAVRKVGRRVAEDEEPVSALDEDDPNSPNYRYADTGYVAGSRKELAASQVIKSAKQEGARVYATAIDWDQLEQNPREAKDLITKSNLFGEVDWPALRAAGMEPGAGFLVDRIYAAIGQEPSEDKPQARKDYAIGLQTLRDRLESAKTAEEVTTVLDALREEYDGKMLTAEESTRYQALGDEARKLWEKSRAIDAENDKRYQAQSRARADVYEVEREVEKRKRRGWAPKPELDAKLAELKQIAEAKDKEWGDELRANKPLREELDQQRRDLHGKRDAIVLAATIRNKLDNPLHRAWNLMGERFVNVLRYRSFKGSDAFAKHVTAAKTGKIADWSWAEKETVRAPRVTKESARFQMRVADSFERVGGRTVTPQSTAELKGMFGLRDVQSGNWVLRDVASAKFHTEHSAAAFADLADLMGAPDEQIAMNGRLALAFGARGHGAKGWKDGAARAHYESVHRVINLTKMGGGGALAHEWFHALDNMAGEAEGGTAGVSDYFTENPDLLPAGELREAVKGLRSAMLDGPHRATRTETYTPEDVRLARRNLGGQFPNAMAKMIVNAGNVHAAVQAIERHFGLDGTKEVSRRSKKLAQDWRRIALGHYGGNAEGGDILVQSGRPMSSFALEAKNLDQGSAEYWQRTHEMAARAFQAWTEDRLADQGRRNDYLSNFADNKYHVDPLFGIEWKPFPEGEERTRINTAFDRLVAAMKASKTLAKAVALFVA